MLIGVIAFLLEFFIKRKFQNVRLVYVVLRSIILGVILSFLIGFLLGREWGFPVAITIAPFVIVETMLVSYLTYKYVKNLTKN